MSQWATAANAAVAPSSTPIAYDGSGNGRVNVVSLDGSNAHPLGPAGASLPSWKPDGSALAMTTASGIAIVKADGTLAQQLPALGNTPTYSPDGTQLLYWTDRTPGTELLTIADADGTNAHVVWDGTKGVLVAELGFLPQWAPDSSAVVFSVFPAGCTWCLESDPPNQVWIVNADGTGLHNVANADGLYHVGWSPDGQWLIGGGLFRIHPDGTGRSTIADVTATAPVSWSPDGRKIAYLGGSGTVTLSVADADGSNRRVLTSADPATTVYSDVQWLPDGSGLVFHVQTQNAGTNTATALIEMVKVNGGGIRTIATGDDPAMPTFITRLAGATRVDTAVSVSRATFTTAPTIVVARDDLFPDALAAGPLAAKVDGPLLLSPPTGVTTALATEVKRLRAKTAYLIGDPTALSANVEVGLRMAGITSIIRIGGTTRYDTARLIADKIGGSAVYIARGDDFADAASVTGLAAYQQRPILLAPPSSLGVATSAALADLHASGATIVGGTSAIASSVQSALASTGITVSRVSGATRYGTSAAVANLAAAAGMNGAPWLADGANWPDALAAGPAAAAVKGNLLLVDPHTLTASPETHTWLIAHSPTSVVALGGPDVVSPVDAAQALTGS